MISIKVLLLLLYISYCFTYNMQIRFKRFPMMQRMRIRERINDRINDRITKHRQRNTLKVCYDTVGCFELPHVNSPLQKTPENPKMLQTKFYLFRRNINFSEPEVIYNSDDWLSLNNSKFNYSQPLKVVVHGYLSNWNEEGNLLTADAYRKLHDCNILILDWAIGASRQYPMSAANTEVVGRILGITLSELIKRGLNPKNIHLIGFSLGAHVSGVASEYLKAQNVLIGRITGLDAAGPLFRRSNLREKSKKLDIEDAEFVDVLHTDSSPSIVDGFGLWEPIGHVDFFANGGKQQPGCVDARASVIATHFEQEYKRDMFCSHIRAVHIFLETLYNELSPNKCKFIAYKCRGGIQSFENGKCFPQMNDANDPLLIQEKYRGDMGLFAEKSVGNGVMYFVTRDSRPLCGTQLQASVHILQTNYPTMGELQLHLNYDSNHTAKFVIKCDLLKSVKEETEVNGITAVEYDAFNSKTKMIDARLVYLNYDNGHMMRLNESTSEMKVSFLINKISVRDIYGHSWIICDNLFLQERDDLHMEVLNFKLERKKSC